LQGHIKLQSGQKILIHGGAGGIGSIAIQIAKHIGAYVATTAAAASMEYVKQLGADEIIDYKAQKFEELVHDFDAVFDTVGGETYEKSFQVLKKGGIIVSMLVTPNEELVHKYEVTAIIQSTQVNTESLVSLGELVKEGSVKAFVDKVFPLEQVADAFSAQEHGSVHGKIVIEITQ
jgi:NADPH:quinone reductase-like Zn-dependent oxidoreductase